MRDQDFTKEQLAIRARTERERPASAPVRPGFDFALPNGVRPPETTARPNWCGASGCSKTAEPGTARCADCRDIEFTARIKARKSLANEEGDHFALGKIDREVLAWRAKGRRFFG